MPGSAGKPASLDQCARVSRRPQLPDQGVSLRRRVPDLRAFLDIGVKAASGQVAGHPAARKPIAEEAGRDVVNGHKLLIPRYPKKCSIDSGPPRCAGVVSGRTLEAEAVYTGPAGSSRR